MARAWELTGWKTFTTGWALTGDSYINGLVTNPGIAGAAVSNITGNGHNIYYLKSASIDLNGGTYNLVNGGQLIPQ